MKSRIVSDTPRSTKIIGDSLRRPENLVVSPHVAGTGGLLAQRFAALVSENLTCFKEGRPLLNEVKVGALQSNE